MSAKKEKKPKPKPMSKRQYLNALDELGLTVAGQRTALAFGVSIRHCQRMAAGDVEVPGPLEQLLKMYLKHPREVPQLPPE